MWRRFQQGEGHSRGLFRDCKTLHNLRQPSCQALPFTVHNRVSISVMAGVCPHCHVWHLTSIHHQHSPALGSRCTSISICSALFQRICTELYGIWNVCMVGWMERRCFIVLVNFSQYMKLLWQAFMWSASIQCQIAQNERAICANMFHFAATH